MSHGHTHDHGTDHSHGHGHGHAAQACEHEADEAASTNSQRYEMQDLFRGEAPENQHFFKVAGLVLLVTLLGLALAYPFLFRNP